MVHSRKKTIIPNTFPNHPKSMPKSHVEHVIAMPKIIYIFEKINRKGQTSNENAENLTRRVQHSAKRDQKGAIITRKKPKKSQGATKGTKREPKGAKREQKASNSKAKGAKRGPMDSKGRQKIAKGRQKGGKRRPKCMKKSISEK